MNETLAPFVSIIMPIRNEADFIVQSLSVVLSQDYPHDRMEILIADGMSDDGTREIVQQLATQTSIPVKLIDNPGRIVPKGFNAALKHGCGEIIVRVDGHCVIALDYVSQCVHYLLTTDAAGVGGPIETISLTTAGEAIAVAMSSPFGVGGSSFRTVKDQQMYVDTIAFPAYKRSAMEVAGPLDEELVRNQDDEFNYRLRSRGYKLLLVPQIQSKYYSRTSLGKLWRQYYQYGLYKVRVLQKHPRQMRPRQFAPLMLVIILIGGALLSPFNGAIRELWMLALGVYIIANLIASILTAAKSEWQHLALLPLTFTTLHLSYGLGFLCGLWIFRGQWRTS